MRISEYMHICISGEEIFGVRLIYYCSYEGLLSSLETLFQIENWREFKNSSISLLKYWSTELLRINCSGNCFVDYLCPKCSFINTFFLNCKINPLEMK